MWLVDMWLEEAGNQHKTLTETRGVLVLLNRLEVSRLTVLLGTSRVVRLRCWSGKGWEGWCVCCGDSGKDSWYRILDGCCCLLVEGSCEEMADFGGCLGVCCTRVS